MPEVKRFSGTNERCAAWLKQQRFVCDHNGWAKPGWLAIIDYHEGQFHAAAWRSEHGPTIPQEDPVFLTVDFLRKRGACAYAIEKFRETIGGGDSVEITPDNCEKYKAAIVTHITWLVDHMLPPATKFWAEKHQLDFRLQDARMEIRRSARSMQEQEDRFKPVEDEHASKVAALWCSLVVPAQRKRQAANARNAAKRAAQRAASTAPAAPAPADDPAGPAPAAGGPATAPETAPETASDNGAD